MGALARFRLTAAPPLDTPVTHSLSRLPRMDVALDQPVLVLNRLWQAVNVIGAKRAFALLARGHAHVVHHHDEDFRIFSIMDWIDFSKDNPPLVELETVHTPNRTIRLPRVILLTFFDKL